AGTKSEARGPAAPDARFGGGTAPHHARLGGTHGGLGRFSQRPWARVGAGGGPEFLWRQWRTVLLFFRSFRPSRQLRPDEVGCDLQGHEPSGLHRRVPT